MNDLETLSFKFFKTFSRLEYALKQSGKIQPNTCDAQPNWNHFNDKLNAVIESEEDRFLAEAIEFISTNPPKKQCVEGGQLYWKLTHEGQRVNGAILIVFITRVRNNLFNGGKYGSWYDKERASDLLENCIIILNYLIDQDPDIKDTYDASEVF